MPGCRSVPHPIAFPSMEFIRMTTNAENAAAVYLYQGELKHGCGYSQKTMDAVLRHIWQFDQHLGSIDFRKVTRKMIEAFKDHLIEHSPNSDGNTLSASTIVHTFGNLKAFFTWLAEQEGYKRAITPRLYNHFAPPRDLVEIAGAAAPKFVPTADQLKLIISTMPTDLPAQRRDRAMLAALFLFGIRDGALISLRLKHIDVDRKQVFQDAREVRTKFSKTSVVDWFPMGEDIEAIVTDWIAELRMMGAGDDAPFCPTTPFKPWLGASSIELHFLTTAAPVRQVLKKAANAAGVPYFKPHAVRSTVAVMCNEWTSSFKERKAFSQNFGHEKIDTTDKYYGVVDEDSKREIFAKMRERQRNPTAQDIAELSTQADEATLNYVRQLLEMAIARNK